VSIRVIRGSISVFGLKIRWRCGDGIVIVAALADPHLTGVNRGATNHPKS
jgi:hypothetical protein